MKITRHPLFIPDEAAAAIPADAALINRLEASFACVAAPDSRFADRVYQRLFEAAPHLRPLFPTDMSRQKHKLVASLRLVIDHLREPAAVRNRLLELGRAHVAFGARPEHYPLVSIVIVGAMADVSGAAWSRELAADWTSAMHIVSAIMIEGAHPAGRDADPRSGPARPPDAP
jgi:nitric oxide dioxygenase